MGAARPPEESPRSRSCTAPNSLWRDPAAGLSVRVSPGVQLRGEMRRSDPSLGLLERQRAQTPRTRISALTIILVAHAATHSEWPPGGPRQMVRHPRARQRAGGPRSSLRGAMETPKAPPDPVRSSRDLGFLQWAWVDLSCGLHRRTRRRLRRAQTGRRSPPALDRASG